MNSEKLLKGFTSNGWLPRELPGAFSSKSFSDNALQLAAEWEKANLFKIENVKLRGRSVRGAYKYSGISFSEPSVISKPKRGFERRNIHITHPIPQTLLFSEISNNWKTISNWLSRSKYSIDKMRVSGLDQLIIDPIDFSEHSRRQRLLKSTNNWIVTTDITRFYPSIYTHSIAWAAYGKSSVKSNLKIFDHSLADRLDRLVRACNSNQTIGIPIGPESSRIIAEVVSSRIDETICLELERNGIDASEGNIDRMQDDWTIGVTDFHKADAALSAIRIAYNDFGLEINGNKTSIEESSKAIDKVWLSEIRGYLSHRPYEVLVGTRLEEFLNLCMRLQIQYPADPVISYCLSVISSQEIGERDVNFVESFLLQCLVVSPICADKVCNLIINLNFQKKKLNIPRIRGRIIELLQIFGDKSFDYEVMWLLYLIRGLNLSINSRSCTKAICENANSATKILVSSIRNRSTIVGSDKYVRQWQDDLTPDSIIDSENWLFGYEAIRKGWIEDTKNLMEEPFFSTMNNLDISFFDERKNVKMTELTKYVVTADNVSNRRRKLIRVRKARKSYNYPKKKLDFLSILNIMVGNIGYE